MPPKSAHARRASNDGGMQTQNPLAAVPPLVTDDRIWIEGKQVHQLSWFQLRNFVLALVPSDRRDQFEELNQDELREQFVQLLIKDREEDPDNAVLTWSPQQSRFEFNLATFAPRILALAPNDSVRRDFIENSRDFDSFTERLKALGFLDNGAFSPDVNATNQTSGGFSNVFFGSVPLTEHGGLPAEERSRPSIKRSFAGGMQTCIGSHLVPS